MPISITISPDRLRTLRKHLFTGKHEQVVFGFAAWTRDDEGGAFRIESLELVPAAGFAFQSDYHIELSDETQASIIKQAFDRRSSLIEFHSHRTRWPAQFSLSDFRGFDEFVPHARWRLGGRPYAAVVFSESGFDGLAQVEDHPVQADHITPGGMLSLAATRLSLRATKEDHDR